MAKERNLLYVLMLILINSCAISYDSEGSASFYVYNGLLQAIRIVAQKNGGTSKPIEIVVNSLETVKIMDDSGIGVNPTAEISFRCIYAKDHLDAVIYSQDPIGNQVWIKEADNPDKNDCYHANYTLKIFND